MNRHIYFAKSNGLLLIVFSLLLSITSCQKKQETVVTPKQKKGKLNPLKPYPDYKVIEIEGCEYFSYISYYNLLDISHKGNCKNPIHCYNAPTKSNEILSKK